ncbi:hypothetical protein DFH08DRAFT_893346 [Mycena albidolilacea]|uniref:CBM1 domain-containing protein n=1 Tax=Mycena albidolilacea TaxID=1033008 RepID=A0AAD7EFF8_9AGAR|nr:hypothetical protein DFH08DRAFT_893346 [Mycena albidolilacea]
MIRSLSVLILALSVAFVAGQNIPLGQCGGIDYAGPTACGANLSCTEINAWYYQCLPVASTAAN